MRDTFMIWQGAAVIVAAIALPTAAHAEEPHVDAPAEESSKLRAQFETPAPPGTIWSLACSLDVHSVIGGRSRPIDIQVPRGCSSPARGDALHAAVTTWADPNGRALHMVVVELEVPDGVESETTVDELKEALRAVASELRRRAAVVVATGQPQEIIRGSFPIRVREGRALKGVCAVNATMTAGGRTWPIWIQAEHDGALEPCAAQQQNALRVVVRFTPESMIIELETPPGASAECVDDLRRDFPELGVLLQARSAARWTVGAPPTDVVAVVHHPGAEAQQANDAPPRAGMPASKTAPRSIPLVVVGGVIGVAGFVGLIPLVAYLIHPIFTCTFGAVAFALSNESCLLYDNHDFQLIGLGVGAAGVGTLVLGAAIAGYGLERVQVTSHVSVVPTISPRSAGGALVVTF